MALRPRSGDRAAHDRAVREDGVVRGARDVARHDRPRPRTALDDVRDADGLRGRDGGARDDRRLPRVRRRADARAGAVPRAPARPAPARALRPAAPRRCRDGARRGRRRGDRPLRRRRMARRPRGRGRAAGGHGRHPRPAARGARPGVQALEERRRAAVLDIVGGLRARRAPGRGGGLPAVRRLRGRDGERRAGRRAPRRARIGRRGPRVGAVPARDRRGRRAARHRSRSGARRARAGRGELTPSANDGYWAA